MILQNINSKRKDSGFTIVELLVVIVVIGILAAITIVSYTGITARANSARAAQNADSVASVASAYAADPANTGIPSLANLNSYTTFAKVPAGIQVIVGAANALSAGADQISKILYAVDTSAPTTGACVGYWGDSGMAYKYIGTATTASLNQVGPTCD